MMVMKPRTIGVAPGTFTIQLGLPPPIPVIPVRLDLLGAMLAVIVATAFGIDYLVTRS